MLTNTLADPLSIGTFNVLPRYPLYGVTPSGPYSAVSFFLETMPWKCAVGRLQRQLPIDHFPCTVVEFGPVEVFRSGDESLDDVAGGLGIAGQPAVLETPAGSHPARIGLVPSHILRAAQPVDGAAQMGTMVLLGLPGCSGDVLHHQTQMAPFPGFVTKRKLYEG